MAKLSRVDAELVRRKLARSRQEAAELIQAGLVTLDGIKVEKSARMMDPAQAVEVIEERKTYVSRGAYKLLGALEYLGEAAPKIAGRRCLDAGASTGGFTQVLLEAGAREVVAVDVGYGQLAWQLQQDPRVQVVDRSNIRYLTTADIGAPAELIVSDLSFISLRLVIPALVKLATPDTDYLLMVKPQFEVGKELLGAGGVVRDPQLHQQAVLDVALVAVQAGLDIWAVAPSPLPGPSGNVEYFLALRAGHPAAISETNLPKAIMLAIAQGPAGAAGAKSQTDLRSGANGHDVSEQVSVDKDDND